MNGLLCVAAIAASLVATNLANKCEHPRCILNATATHVICKYPDPRPAAACGQVSSTGFTVAEKKEIVNEHNKLRQFVAAGNEAIGYPGPQPAAAGMKILSWDEELAQLAQRWANQCRNEYDDCRDVDRFAVGQNVAFIETPWAIPLRLANFVSTFYKDVEYVNRSWVDKLPPNYNGKRYTQLVWGDTEKVGCGKIVYQSNHYLVVCNYGPSGNRVGQPIYKARK